MSKIEKHGRPTRATVGAKGDIYTDLDTGVKYECHGTRGFIDIDSVDEPIQYDWRRVDESEYDLILETSALTLRDMSENNIRYVYGNYYSIVDAVKNGKIPKGKLNVVSNYGDEMFNVSSCDLAFAVSNDMLAVSGLANTGLSGGFVIGIREDCTIYRVDKNIFAMES